MATMHTISVSGLAAEVDERRVAQGSEGADLIVLVLGRGWEGATPSLVLSGKAGTFEPKREEDGTFEFPWELAREAGEVEASVVGRVGERETLMHARMRRPFTVLPGGPSCGPAPTDPTVTEYRAAYEAAKAASITSVKVETGEPGTEATATRDVTPDGTEVTIRVPRGDQGETGERGPKGDRGDKGDKLAFSDLTESDIEELRRPADEAARRCDEAVEGISSAWGSLRVVDGAIYIEYLLED